MTQERKLESIPDDELLDRLAKLLDRSRRDESALVAHIGEVDRRRLFAREAVPSMFSYATDILHLSENEAYLRITAARASRSYPVLLEMLADGRLHLSGIAKLAPHLTKENYQTLLARATHKTKRQIEELLAELAPKPDVPSTMRKIPTPERKSPPPSGHVELGPDRVTNLHTPKPEPTATPASTTRPRALPPPSTPPPPKVEPLAPARYKITFTASAQLRDKLNRLQALMRSSVPNGDLAAIIEEAVTEKLERLEAKRFAKTKAPRKGLDETDTTPSSRHIPAAFMRAVVERDGNQCTFVDARGRRCPERNRLEFHHHDPFGVGGDHDMDNISLRCRAHNQYQAELDYGKAVMARHGRLNGNGIVRESSPAYSAGRDRQDGNTAVSSDGEFLAEPSSTSGRSAGTSSRTFVPPLRDVYTGTRIRRSPRSEDASPHTRVCSGLGTAAV